MYSIDTSALIDAWHRDYRLPVFESLWQRIANLIDAGHLVASMTVRDELLRQEDTLAEWADGNPGLFVEDDEEIQAGVRALLAGWPRQVNFSRFLTGADPFVVALARRRDFAAVASEKASGNPEAPRIPDACRHYRVRCIRAMDMFEELGWRF
jgi:Domain of unknown function (DUF4411)